jgi:hypothetical protein
MNEEERRSVDADACEFIAAYSGLIGSSDDELRRYLRGTSVNTSAMNWSQAHFERALERLAPGSPRICDLGENDKARISRLLIELRDERFPAAHTSPLSTP